MSALCSYCSGISVMPTIWCTLCLSALSAFKLLLWLLLMLSLCCCACTSMMRHSGPCHCCSHKLIVWHFSHHHSCRHILLQPIFNSSLQHQHLMLRFVAAPAMTGLPPHKQLLLLLHDYACSCTYNAFISSCDDHNAAAGLSTFCI